MRSRMLAMWVAVVPWSVALAAEPTTVSQGRREEARREAAPSPCCAAGIVPAGHFEVEATYSGDGVRGDLVHTSTLTFKYSLTDRVQLQLGTANFLLGGGGVAPRAVDGLSPGVKLVLSEQVDLWPQLAVSVHGIFPTLARDDARQRTVDAMAMFYASQDIGRLHLDVTLSLTVADLAGSPLTQGAASVTATWNFTSQWAVASGPYSAFGAADRLGVDGGWFGALNYSPIPALALNAGAEVGFFPGTRSWSVFAGMAWVPTAL